VSTVVQKKPNSSKKDEMCDASNAQLEHKSQAQKSSPQMRKKCVKVTLQKNLFNKEKQQ
jgi:hypothetical protein